MTLLIKSFLSGMILTIIAAIAVVIADSYIYGGISSGKNFFERAPFAWMFFWWHYFFNQKVESLADLDVAIISNTVVYTILSFIFFWRHAKDSDE